MELATGQKLCDDLTGKVVEVIENMPFISAAEITECLATVAAQLISGTRGQYGTTLAISDQTLHNHYRVA